MARLLLAWELGNGLGHVLPMSQLAMALCARGHEVHLVLRDLSLAGAGLGRARREPGLHLWQAPIWLHPLVGRTAPSCHAELLFEAGYLNAERLSGLVQAWRQLLDRLKPDLLVADFAPTALLAARGRRLCRVLFGSGFSIPPDCTPVPSYREWDPPAPGQVEAAQSQVLATCNQVLAALGEPPMHTLNELHRADEVWLTGWPAWDPYRAWRAGTSLRCWGALPAPELGLPPSWPAAGGRRVLAYLHAEHPALEQVLKRMAAGPWCVLACVTGVSVADAQRQSGPQLQIVTEPLALGAALAQADAYLGHGGLGATTSALAAGLPCVLLPLHEEQLLLARRVSAAGAGVLLLPGEAAAGLVPALSAVLGSPGFGLAARAMAEHQPAWPADQLMPAMAERCEQLLAGLDQQPGSMPTH